MKLSFIAIFAFVAATVGNVVEAFPVPESLAKESDAAPDRFLRKKKADAAPKDDEAVVKHFNHIHVEEIGVNLAGPGDYSDPSDEEIGFFMDALMTSFEKTDEGLGYEADLAILENIEEVEGEGDGRKLMGYWDRKLCRSSLHCRYHSSQVKRPLTRSFHRSLLQCSILFT